MTEMQEALHRKVLKALRDIPGPRDVMDILKLSLVGAAFSAMNIVLFTVSRWHSLGGVWLFAWCVLSLALVGWVLMKAVRVRGVVVKRVSHRAKRRLLFTSFLSSLPWMMLPILAMPMGSEIDRLVGLILCVGQMFGAAVMLARVYAAVLVYISSVLLGTMTGCFLAEIPQPAIVAAFLMIGGSFIAACGFTTGETSRARDRAIADLSRTNEALEEANRRITTQAYEDPVTGLANRTAFTKAVDIGLKEQAGEACARRALMLFDLDHFKNINDTMGHHAGDELLLLVGDRINRTVGKLGLVARTGGDEFSALLCLDKTDLSIGDLSDRLSEILKAPAMIAGRRVLPSASIGIALIPDHGRGADVIVQRAEAALAAGKEAGRGRWTVFNQRMEDELESADFIAAELRSTLEQEDLCVHYQPKIDLKTGAAVGAEALVRWIHPLLGPIAPDRFLPVASSQALMRKVTRQIFDQVARDIEAMRDRGVHPGRIAVNLHPSDLKEPDNLMAMMRAFADRGIDGDVLSLEITEGCFVGRGTEKAPMVLDALADMGFRLSLDDFGTGYAALTHLRSLPVSELKIDRSFVRGIMENTSDRAIVSGTIAIAREMGLASVAEGVEDAEHLAHVRALGADMGQGYFWAGALPLDAFEAFHRAARGDRNAGRGVS